MGVKMSEEKISADVSLNHEVPSFLCVGFSGRKTADTSRPTVLGQVADLSLRTVACPAIVVKYPPTDTPSKTFCLFAADVPRCWTAFQMLLHLIKPEDTLACVHLQDSAPEAAQQANALKAKRRAARLGPSTRAEERAPRRAPRTPLRASRRAPRS